MSHTEICVGLNGLESATLFVPGGSSYIAESPNGDVSWVLAERSEQRAAAARNRFDPSTHDVAVFSAGSPGVAAGWNDLDPKFTPPAGRGEATGMSGPLLARLRSSGWTESAIADRVKVYDLSRDTFGDVLGAVESGLLNPNTFHTNDRHGVEIVAGRQAVRVAAIVEKALDLDPIRIRRTGFPDVLNRRGGGAYPPAPESRAKAWMLERAALSMTRLVLRDVEPGDLGAVRAAQEHFARVAAGGIGAALIAQFARDA